MICRCLGYVAVTVCFCFCFAAGVCGCCFAVLFVFLLLIALLLVWITASNVILYNFVVVGWFWLLFGLIYFLFVAL